MGFEVGAIVDHRFVLLERIGLGSEVVWRARDREFPNREVALRIFEPRTRRRLVFEDADLARVDHVNIAGVVASGGRGRETYLATELVRGQTLAERLERRARERRLIPLSVVAWIAREIASAIDHAHLLGVLHRNLKPQNVMMHAPGKRPFVKLLDFDAASVRFDRDVSYVAPEQLSGGSADASGDVFAFACLLFEALTLRRVWAHDRTGRLLMFHHGVGDQRINGRFEIARRIAGGPRPSVAELRPHCPRGLDVVFERAWAKNPTDRHQSCGALARDLARFIELTSFEQQETIRIDEARILSKLRDRGRRRSPMRFSTVTARFSRSCSSTA